MDRSQKVNSVDYDGGVSKPFEAKHWTKPQFDPALILSNHIAQIL
jgi:hypothetical protein